MEEPKASRQRATGTKPRKRKSGNSGKIDKHFWTETETQFLFAYLQWSVNHQVDFFRVAMPRFIKATGCELRKQQIENRLRLLHQSRRLSGVAWREFLKTGPGALRLPDETVEQFKRILESIPSPDAEPCSLTRTLEQIEESEIGKGDAIAFLPTSEHEQQMEVTDDDGPRNEQPAITCNPFCEQSVPSEGDHKQTPANMSDSNKRKISELESQLFVSQNETARYKRQLEELPDCSLDAVAINTLKGYFETDKRRLSLEKAFDVNSPRMSDDKISHAYAVLFEQIQSACSHIVEQLLNDVVPDPEFDFSELAKLWAYQTFKKDLAKSLQHDVGKIYSKEELLVGLITAALIEHVFEPTFPGLLQSSWLTSNPYRDFILKTPRAEGANALHKADYTTLPILMSHQKSSIINAKVGELHQVLSKSLEPFWNSRVFHKPQNIADDNDLSIIEMPTQSPDLRQFLHSAVELKYKLTASTTRLKFLYFQPQDLFDEKRMVRCKGSDPNGWRIIACFFPALLHPPPRPANTSSDEDILDCNIHYNMYFTKFLAGNPLCLDVAAKAIVLT
ncbi:Ff.00g101900.m01.CDS01 [Fusarium sp. VM40]|nr:Ff.00g101900.m01.CDS01 [Fusarium sp. VM40]